ncbi:hypothetical protein PR048_019315 [Dryococelus australis]|uniref:Uncharacterized protein n=1 Tax=Dryococelus australis TaxID=614101 RepID=A0ABQ9H358_9NEOP|nr:hypothetical protein PR048_019315 [Dryococelus australis]
MKPFRVKPPKARSVVENTLGAIFLVFRFLRIPILLKPTSLLSLVVTEAYLHIFFVNCLLRRPFIRLQEHLIENKIDNLFQVYGRITQNPMRCSLSETHLNE